MIDRRAYIVDDDEAIRRTIRRMLTELGIYTEEFGSAETFLAGYEDRPIGCVLLDLRLPGMDGLEVLNRIVGLAPANPIIMLSGFGDIPSAVRAVKTGALDFLQKPFRKEQLLDLVTRAFEKIAAMEASGLKEIEPLTPREREVLVAFADGAANKVVAARLNISPRTVEMHRARVFRKLRVTNLAQALFRAKDLGFIR